MTPVYVSGEKVAAIQVPFLRCWEFLESLNKAVV